ncbi:MAG: OmpA family protein [Deltaproteobacteria bacterium]|nr:OmpA family protein [Deltaproteobacteria bacterium]
MQRTKSRNILSAACGIWLGVGATAYAQEPASPAVEDPAAAPAAPASTPAQSIEADKTLELPPPAAAAPSGEPRGLQVELGLFGGYHLWAKDLELGVADSPGRGPNFSGQFGLRLALNFLPTIGIESEVSGLPTSDRRDDIAAFIMIYRLHLLAHVATWGDFRPFVLAGVNLAQVADTDGSAIKGGIEEKDKDGGFHVGAGMKWDISKTLLARFDARTSWLPDWHDGGVTPSFELLAGLGVKFGGSPPPPPPPPPPPADTDGDGLLDPEDQCPTEKEDVDNFQDEDGCPDPDNDNDGVLDGVDKCPLEAETMNGVDDQDGCPESDEDKDGLFGSADKCPTEAEDADGFQDEDGCPDPDNDGDGVLDADDKCPTELETKNGFQDGDGCPDELPKEVQKFTGVIQGITFKKNSAAIAKSSFKVLAGAVKVLKDYPDLRIEISGHTSSEGVPEKNMQLSHDRADSVKEYLVSAGIDASRIESKGYGPDQPIAPNATKKGREQNRRIEFKLITK